MTSEAPDAVGLTAEIIAAYAENNEISLAELPALIGRVHRALSTIGRFGEPASPTPKPPAVAIRRSIEHDHLICLEDGKRLRSLKRHLRTNHDLSPETYRAKWGLPGSYPMVAPSYAQVRSAHAKAMGLGGGGRRPAKATGRASKSKALV
jgi:predicted transcriptional regulator